MKRQEFSAALFIGLAVLLLGSSHDAVRAANWTITMGADDRFHPDFLSIELGDSVTWLNADTEFHTSTSGPSTCIPDGLWDSGFLDTGEDFLLVPAAMGSFPYFCTLHCDDGMVGVLEVRENTAPDQNTWGKIKALFNDDLYE